MRDWNATRRVCAFAVVSLTALTTVRCGFGATRTSDGHTPLVEALHALALPQTTTPRVSISSDAGHCEPRLAAGDVIPRTQCEPVAGIDGADDRVQAIAREAALRVRDQSDADGLHAVALIDLLWADAQGKVLDRSIIQMEAAARIRPPTATLLADLSAAYLTRSESEQSARDIIVGMDLARKATQIDSMHGQSRYNRALSEAQFGLLDQAKRDWTSYARTDAESRWASDARQRSQAISIDSSSARRQNDAVDPRVVATRARINPSEATSVALTSLLGRWFSARETGDAAGARTLLNGARTIADSLIVVQRDSSLLRMLNAITRAEGSERAIAVLGRAHALFAEGVSAYDGAHYQASLEKFDAALRLRPPSEALVAWCSLLRAASQLLVGRADEAEPTLLAIKGAGADFTPVIAARARLTLGTARLRAGRYEEALVFYREASQLFRSANETEVLGATYALTGEAEFALGRNVDGYRSMLVGLTLLSRFPNSVRRHAALYALAKAAAGEGFLDAAIAIQSEGVAVASRMRSPLHEVEARLALLRYRADAARQSASGNASDDATGARTISTIRQELDAVAAEIASLEQDPREWFTAQRQQTTGELLARQREGSAVAVLDSAVAYYEARKNALKLVPSLIARADASLGAQHAQPAMQDLQRAVAMLQAQTVGIDRSELRTSFLDATHRTFDRLVMLQLATGDHAAALRTLESGRNTARLVSSRPSASRGTSASASTRAIVDYALIGDTLLIWSGRSDRPEFSRRPIARREFDNTLSLILASLELGVDNDTVSTRLAKLYDLFIRPIAAAALVDGEPLTIIADGSVASIPFAALRDSTRGEYLIAQRELRFAQSLADLDLQTDQAPSIPSSALLIGDPAFALHAGFQRLAGARDEVAGIAHALSNPTTLTDTAARLGRISSVVQRTALFHFAGHAVLDESRPERSYLLVAPDSTGGATTLLAKDIATLDLRRVQLTVLSACQTMYSRDGHSGAVDGIASAMLAAGAHGVIASQWRIDDRLTAKLMMRLYESLATRTPAAALRAAQRAMINDQNPTAQSPSAWASFRYIAH